MYELQVCVCLYIYICVCVCVCVCRGWVVLYPVGLTLNTHTQSCAATEAGVRGRLELQGVMLVCSFSLNKSSGERQTDRRAVL